MLVSYMFNNPCFRSIDERHCEVLIAKKRKDFESKLGEKKVFSLFSLDGLKKEMSVTTPFRNH